MMGGPALMRIDHNDSITRSQITPGTMRRVLPYTVRYRRTLIILLIASALDAGITAAIPVILKFIIDNGILPRRLAVVVELSLLTSGLALFDALMLYIESWFSASIGQGVIYDLRFRVFTHVQKQPLAFFTRAETGALVSRLNTDIIGAQAAVTALLSQTLSTVLTLVFVLGSMFYLSWQISLSIVVLVPFFLLLGKLIGRRLQRLAREQMQLDADLGSMMSERFNVVGALLVKLYGRPSEESSSFAKKAGRLRDISIATSVQSRVFVIYLTLFGSLITALVYGFGGSLVIVHAFQIGTLVAMALLLTRLYVPIAQLSSMQINVMTALVSFDRVFEVLDLKPLVAEPPDAYPLPYESPGGRVAPAVEFEGVSFRYPTAEEVSLASLESIALPKSEAINNTWILNDVSFCAPAEKLTAIVGPSGAGKTTITYLVSRLYDPVEGMVRIGGHDIRNLTLQSLNDTVGIVTQDPHLFHDTIRANLAYARPGATEQELIAACMAAQVWDLINSLPDGLDTVTGDRGYRFSGGEKQRLALARLLLKGPQVVILDEATAHLDSESEEAIQDALKTALMGRTSVVIAHRLSTIREANQIVVIDEGQVRECGAHEELLSMGGLYADLYAKQFAWQSNRGGNPE